MTPVKYLDAQALIDALPWPRLIDALDQIFAREVVEPVRHQHSIEVPGEPDATLLLKPAWITGAYLGVKQVAVFPGNNARGEPALNSSYVLSCAKTGRPLLQLDANELTSRRTAAASALASRYLSRANSSTLLMMGAGRMARTLIQAHCAVRPIDTVYVWNRSRASADRLIDVLGAQSVNVKNCSDQELPDVAGRADIISCATLATEAILHGEWLRPGTHIDLVGSFRADMRETDDETIRKATIFVDTRAGALAEAGDLIQPMENDVFKPQDVIAEFSQLCSGQHSGRSQLANSDEQITLFKSVGAAREDLAAAILAYDPQAS